MSTTQQPEALHYAEILENFYSGIGRRDAIGASAELRRLHAENTTLQAGYAAARLEIVSLRASQEQAPAQAAPWTYSEIEARIKDLMAGTAHPNSLSVAQAMKQLVNELWQRYGQAPTTQAAPAAVAGPSEAVAYLDIGAGGYLDLGTDLTDEALSRLSKGRHALVIAGTYGIDGYIAAPIIQPAPQQEAQTPAHIKAMERAWLWMENQADSQSKGGHATFDLMMLREERDALRAALDAAPIIQPAPQHQARPVTPYTCPKCSALWLHWPAEQSGFGRDTLNCRSTTHCDYCEKGGVEQLQRLERVPAVLAAPQPSPAAQGDAQDAAPTGRCQHCIDRHDGIYGSWAAPCPYHDDDGKPRIDAARAAQEGK